MSGDEYKIIGTDGREYVAASLNELRAWVEEGRVGPGTLVWVASEQRWQGASTVPELRWDLPTAPPVMAVVEQPSGADRASGMVNAEFPFRAAAFIVDIFILAALFSLVTLPWSEGLRELQEAAMKETAKERPNLDVIFRFNLLFLGVYVPLRLVYHAGFHASLGATPGKLLFGLKVVREDGTTLPVGRAVTRAFAEWLSLAALGIGYLIAPMHPERRALHDIIAGTRVVRRPIGSAVGSDGR